jgi:hypothetical protein
VLYNTVLLSYVDEGKGSIERNAKELKEQKYISSHHKSKNFAISHLSTHLNISLRWVRQEQAKWQLQQGQGCINFRLSVMLKKYQVAYKN